MALSIDDLPVDGKPVTWGYVAGVVVEAMALLAFGWVMLVGAAMLDDLVRGIR